MLRLLCVLSCKHWHEKFWASASSLFRVTAWTDLYHCCSGSAPLDHTSKSPHILKILPVTAVWPMFMARFIRQHFSYVGIHKQTHSGGNQLIASQGLWYRDMNIHDIRHYLLQKQEEKRDHRTRTADKAPEDSWCWPHSKGFTLSTTAKFMLSSPPF